MMSNKAKKPVQTTAQIQAAAVRAERKRAKKAAKAAINAQFRRPAGEVGEFVSQATDLPYNEQMALQGVIDRDPDNMSKGYLKTLVLPQYAMSRIPDSFAGSTAVVHSVTVIDVPVYSTNQGSDTGRFALAIQPHMGSLDGPQKYKVAMVLPNTTTGFPTDLTQPGSFVAVSNAKDIRIDTYSQILTQPPHGVVYYTGDDGAITGALPFGAFITASSGYGLEALYAVNPSAAPGLQGEFRLPAGFYKADFTFLGDGCQISAIAVQLNGTSNGVLNEAIEFANQLADSGGINAYWSGYLNIGRNDILTVNVSGTTIDGNLQTSNVSFTRTYDDTNSIDAISANHGLVQKYRPVACSALCTYTGPPLTGGGNIAVSFLPGSTLEDQFFNNGSTQAMGSLASWQNVAATKGSYDGKLVEGCYGWWAPMDISDYLLRTPDETVDYSFPTLVVAGQYAPGAAFTDGQVIARVEVHTVYEFVTDSLLFESRYQAGSQAIMDGVLSRLVGEPHCMANETHLKFGQKIMAGLKAAGAWLWKNRRPIGSAIGVLGSLV